MNPEVLRELVALVPGEGRPLLIAVDGADGAGKTLFADALAERIAEDTGRPVVRSGVDAFHNPRAYRHAQGRTAETVWERSFDTRSLRRELLQPWLEGPGAGYRRTVWDLEADRPTDEPPGEVPEAGILVFDGVFAQRPGLADAWDLVIWLEAPEAERVRRMAERDGVPEDADHPDQRRYLEAQRRYAAAYDPVGSADVVIDNADWANPVIQRQQPEESWRAEGDWLVREVRIRADRPELARLIDDLEDR